MKLFLILKSAKTMKNIIKAFLVAATVFGMNTANATWGWGHSWGGFSYSKFSHSQHYSYKKPVVKTYHYKKPVVKTYHYKKPVVKTWGWKKPVVKTWGWKKPVVKTWGWKKKPVISKWKKYVHPHTKKHVHKTKYKHRKKRCKSGGFYGGFHGWRKKKCNASPHW